MKTLTEADVLKAAKDLGVNAAAVCALVEVESAGSGFLADGRPKILFERHIMYRRLAEKFGPSYPPGVALVYPSVVNQKPGGYLGGKAEHDRLRTASELDRDCALESASWGAFQIMGFHWKHLGYSSLQEFVNAMYRNEGAHLDAFVRFVLADPRLKRALQNLDWAGVARIYNGPAYIKNAYDTKLAAAYKRHSALV